jgi:hypothetical protein
LIRPTRHLRIRLSTVLGPAAFFASLLALSCLSGAPTAAAAPLVKPWTPPSADSLIIWATEAKTRFQTNTGDSISGSNYRPYDLVGRVARRLLRSLGREHMLQSYAIEPVLDSLGFDTSVALDPKLPTFILLAVRNPYRPTALAVGFLFWYRGDDLRTQGVILSGGLDPRVRVWWTSRQEAPYEWGIIYREKGEELLQHVLLLRLNPNGFFWNLIQYEGNGPDLGEIGDAEWMDVNHDGRPELVAWSRAALDSTFTECPSCPHLINERIYAEREPGFELHDGRLMPSPYATFVTFVRLLRDHNRVAASRLLADPTMIDQAIALGWGARVGPGAWQLEYAEQNEQWPHWLAMKLVGRKGAEEYVVRFTTHNDRWIIKSWGPVAKAGRPGVGAGSR